MDALANFKPTEGQSSFIKFEPDKPVKVRIVSLDPLVSNSKYGKTVFAFAVWNHTAEKAMILNRGPAILNRIQELHLDEEWGKDITKMDIRITAKGTGLETKYSVDPIPKSVDLTEEQLAEVKKLDEKLEEIIKPGIRMSKVNEGVEVPEAEISDDIDDRDVPFDEDPPF